jgi:hypothetical protein
MDIGNLKVGWASYRDASVRLTGTATSQAPSENSSHTIYRDANGRTAGSVATLAAGSSGSGSTLSSGILLLENLPSTGK